MADVPHPGQFLRTRFMEPLGLTVTELARALGVPRSRLSAVLAGNRGMSVDTARRLGAFFQVDPRVFMESQIAWELAQLPDVDIDPAEVDGFLVGPLGVTRVPAATRAPAPPTAVVSPSMLERLRAKAAQTPPSGPRELVQTTWPGGQRAIETKAR